MTKITALWTLVASGQRLRRSSQAVSVLGKYACIFGGELLPREPIDNQVDLVELKPGQGNELPNTDYHSRSYCPVYYTHIVATYTTETLPGLWLTIIPFPNSDSAAIKTVSAPTLAPSPRVGSPSTVLGDAFYIFSGRGGLAMEPIEEKGGLWRYTPASNNWDFIKPEADSSSATSPSFPAGRSYHCITTDNAAQVFVHAGCPENGRLADLWSFNLISKTWAKLPDAPFPARGGPSIAYHDGKIYRMNGFDGTTEQGGAVDVFDCASQTWSTIAFQPDGTNGPEPRSVSSLVAVQIQGKIHLVTLFGERDPSSLGHAGAGKMLDDVWAFDVVGRTWSKVDAQGTPPAPRGWFDADVSQGSSVVVHGGLAEDNSRLGDIWELKFV